MTKYYGMFVKESGRCLGKCKAIDIEKNMKNFESTCVDVEFIEVNKDVTEEEIAEISNKIKEQNNKEGVKEAEE